MGQEQSVGEVGADDILQGNRTKSCRPRKLPETGKGGALAF